MCASKRSERALNVLTVLHFTNKQCLNEKKSPKKNSLSYNANF